MRCDGTHRRRYRRGRFYRMGATIFLFIACSGCQRAAVNQRLLEASTGHPDSYQALPIEGLAVDAATEHPLQGVIVVAAWLLSPNPDVGALEVLETVTDERGHFAFPGWGPKPAPERGRLQNEDPRIYLFMPGYDRSSCSNPAQDRYIINKNSVRSTECNGRRFKLQRFQGTPVDYGKMLARFDDISLRFAFDYEDCAWKQIPRTLSALDREAQRLQAKGARRGFSERPLTLEERDTQRSTAEINKCGSMGGFVQGQER